MIDKEVIIECLTYKALMDYQFKSLGDNYNKEFKKNKNTKLWNKIRRNKL